MFEKAEARLAAGLALHKQIHADLAGSVDGLEVDPEQKKRIKQEKRKNSMNENSVKYLREKKAEKSAELSAKKEKLKVKKMKDKTELR